MVVGITYLGNRANPCYLSLITDAYSKMIVGHCVSDNCIKALMMAVKNRKYKTVLIHHSDRGLQYFSDAYQQSLSKNGIRCSMTESYDPYQNAVAERVNGILKQEFMIDDQFEFLPVMKKIVRESIDIYNNERLQYSCFMKTPQQMHAQSEIKMRIYSLKKQNKQCLISLFQDPGFIAKKVASLKLATLKLSFYLLLICVAFLGRVKIKLFSF